METKKPSENLWPRIFEPVLKLFRGKRKTEDSLDYKKKREREEGLEEDKPIQKSDAGDNVSHPKLKVLLAQLKEGEGSSDEEDEDETGGYSVKKKGTVNA